MVGISGNQTPIALVGDSFADAAMWIGGVAFVVIVWLQYRWISRLVRP